MLTLFGFAAVATMLVTYALEERHAGFVAAFAVACVAAATYGFLIEAWPFAAVEVVWALVALRRWWGRRGASRGGGRPHRAGVRG